MARIVVLGTSGAGKTTVARALADRLGADLIDLEVVHLRSQAEVDDWLTAPG